MIACQAILYRQGEVFRLAVTALDKAFNARLLSPDSVAWVGTDAARAQHYLDVFIRVLAIGALAGRREPWDLLPVLSNRSLNESGYEWVSWLRHPLVMASRANLLPDHDGRSCGTGYSLLKAVATLPLDVLKIDRSFVTPLVFGGDSLLVTAMTGIARGRGLETIGEGIETSDQLVALIAADCDVGQGYLFARPLERDQLEAMLNLEPGFQETIRQARLRISGLTDE